MCGEWGESIYNNNVMRSDPCGTLMAILWSSVVSIKKGQAKPLAIKYIRHFPFQVLISELLELWGDEGFFKHTKSVQDFYLQQRNAMVAAAEKHLSGWYCIHIFLNYFSVNRYYISDYLVSRLLFLRKKNGLFISFCRFVWMGSSNRRNVSLVKGKCVGHLNKAGNCSSAIERSFYFIQRE